MTFDEWWEELIKENDSLPWRQKEYLRGDKPTAERAWNAAQQVRWTPTSDRLPREDEGMSFLVTLRDGTVSVSGWWCGRWDDYPNEYVVAWAVKPEGWKS